MHISEMTKPQKTDFKDTNSSLIFTELIQDFSKKDETLINILNYNM